jgi:hypothetical protein
VARPSKPRLEKSTAVSPIMFKKFAILVRRPKTFFSLCLGGEV